MLLAFPRPTPLRKFRAQSVFKLLFSFLDLLFISGWCRSPGLGWILSWTSALNECCASDRSQQVMYHKTFPSCPVYQQITSNNWYFHTMENTEIWNGESQSWAGLSRERLKDKVWALPCLPYLGFNQPKPLPSQQDFSLPRELCENWGRASGRSSTIAKK